MGVVGVVGVVNFDIGVVTEPHGLLAAEVGVVTGVASLELTFLFRDLAPVFVGVVTTPFLSGRVLIRSKKPSSSISQTFRFLAYEIR